MSADHLNGRPAFGGEFQVQRNVPLPGRNLRSLPLKYPWATMAVGDMFFVPAVKGVTIVTLQNRVCSSARYARTIIDRKFKITTRMMTQDGVAGVGVWRIA